MALEIFACETQTGRVLAQLPGRPAGPISRTANTSEALTVEVDAAHPALPTQWRELLTQHSRSILVVSDVDGVRTPVYLGTVNDLGVTNGQLEVQTASLEWFMDARRPSDRTWGAATPLMQVARDLHANFEAGGVGLGLDIDAPNTTTKRAWQAKRSSGKSFADVLDDLNLEWTIALGWADNEARVTKTLVVRPGPTGAAPKRQLSIPTDAVTWSWNDSRLEAQSSTVVFVEGEGNGDLRTTSLPHVDYTAEAAGCPRVEAWETAAGVTSVKEANALAVQHTERRFAEHEALEVTVRNDGVVGLAGLALGDSLRVVVDHPALDLDKIYRLAAWELDAAGETWTPGFVGANEPLTGWRKPGLGTAAKKARKDERAAAKRYVDPLANGWKGPPDIDGKKWVWDPKLGPGWEGPDGKWNPPTTPDGPKTPAAEKPGPWEWGTEGGDEWGAPLVAPALRLAEEKVLPPTGEGPVPVAQNGRFVYNAVPVAWQSSSYTLQEAGPLVEPETVPELEVWAGELRDGSLVGWGQRGTATIPPATLLRIMRNSTAWLAHGYSGANVRANASWSSYPLYANGRLYAQVRLALTIDGDYNRESVDTFFVSLEVSGAGAFGDTWSWGEGAVLRGLDRQVLDMQAVGPRIVAVHYQGHNLEADPVWVLDMNPDGSSDGARELPPVPRGAGGQQVYGLINALRVGEQFRLHRGTAWLPVNDRLEAAPDAEWTIPPSATDGKSYYPRPVHSRLVQGGRNETATEFTDGGEPVQVAGTKGPSTDPGSPLSYGGWLYNAGGTEPGWAQRFEPAE